MAALCEQDWRRTVYEQLHDADLVARLSADGQARLKRFRGELETILARVGQYQYGTVSRARGNNWRGLQP